jgi:ABC-2 type transport system ATP-binding protein
MNTHAVQLERLFKRQGAFALGPLDLAVPQGAVYALVGPNGAGKTTALDLMMGLGRPDAGAVRLLGLDLAAQEVAIKRRVAFVNPEQNFLAWGRVGCVVDFFAGFYPDWDMDRADKLLADFKVGRGEKIAALSFGSRTKLSLVLALARDAELLLLDEPTTGLDPLAKRLFFEELLAVMRRPDRTIVISSHQLADLERFADHIGVLNNGQLLAEGRMDTLVDRYAQWDVDIADASAALPSSLRVLARDGRRARLMVDLAKPPREPIIAGSQIVNRASMTLEEIFVGLVGADETMSVRRAA